MADPRERTQDMDEALRSAVASQLADVWTALPVVVLEDSDGHIVKVRSTIKGWLQDDMTGEVKPTEIPEFGDVPIHYPAGAGFTFTHPIKKGDEGIVVFSSRCIDGWWKEGGVQAEPYRRQHHLGDAMYIPGIRNKPRKLNPYVAKESAQLRTDDQHFYVEIRDDMVRLVYAIDKQEEGGGERAENGGNGNGQNGGNGNGQNGGGQKEEKEKKTQPALVAMVTEDKIKGVVFDEQGEEKSWFEHTKEGAFNIKAPQKVYIETPTCTVKASQQVVLDTPVVKVTGKIIAGGEITAKTGVGTFDADGVEELDERAGSSVSMSTHKHPQGNDSRGDREQDTGVPISGS